MPLDLNTLPMAQIRSFCERHGVVCSARFGSALRDDFAIQSNIGVLIEPAPTTRVGLIGFQGMQDDLTVIFGRKVDLNTSGFLSNYFRDDVVAESEELSVAA